MPRDGRITREKILDAAHGLMLDNGYAGTSVEGVIELAGITKGTFFYHFPSKADLAQALVDRFAALDLEHFEACKARAEKLSKDPLQQVLIMIGLFVEDLSAVDPNNPGCLYAAYCYQSGLLDDAVLEVVRDSLLFWRRELGIKLRQAIEAHSLEVDVDPESLADQLTVAFEGGFILARSLNDPTLVVKAVEHYRDYVERVLSPQPSGS